VAGRTVKLLKIALRKVVCRLHEYGFDLSLSVVINVRDVEVSLQVILDANVVAL
jgi:hypothetical protein